MYERCFYVVLGLTELWDASTRLFFSHLVSHSLKEHKLTHKQWAANIWLAEQKVFFFFFHYAEGKHEVSATVDISSGVTVNMACNSRPK